MTNPDLITMFFEAFNARDLEHMENLLSPKAELYFPKTQPLIGRGRILKFLQILFRRYPQLDFTVQRVIREENHAAVHWTNRGLNRKKEPYSNEGVTILEVEGGRIRYISDFFKDTEKF